MKPNFIGSRLRQAREALGLSLTAFAEILGVTKQAVSRWEIGQDTPRHELIDRICSVLGQPAYFFSTAPHTEFQFGTCFYRSLSSTTKTARTRAEIRKLWAREILSSVLQYVEIPKVTFPIFRLGSPKAEQIDQFAYATREHWGLGLGPVPNLVRVMEDHGAIIVREHLDSETMDALSEWLEPESRPFVLLNEDKGIATRSRLDLAHELGHLVLHRSMKPEALLKKTTFALVERQAFRFAGAFLLPEKPFLADLYSLSLDALRAMKSRWRVSIAAMIARLSELGVLTDDQEKRMWINYSRRGWRSAEPLDGEIEIEQPTLLAKAFDVLVRAGFQADQLPFIIGHGRRQIESLSNLPENFLATQAVKVNVLPFKKTG